jgi:phosphonate transport system substrate-binding protein
VTEAIPVIRAWTLLCTSCTPAFEAIVEHLLGPSSRLATATWPQLCAERPPYVAFACGWHYVQARQHQNPPPRLLAMPQLADPRYAGRPGYFSELVVRTDARHLSLHDLHDASCAFNEEISFSGRFLPAAGFVQRGWARLPFAHLVRVGSHQRALELVVQGHVDAAPVDSWVLDLYRRAHPAAAARLRVLERFGPAPPPPVFGLGLGRAHAPLVSKLLQLSDTAQGRALLDAAGIERFVDADDRDYDPLREAIATAQRLPWTTRDGHPPRNDVS